MENVKQESFLIKILRHVKESEFFANNNDVDYDEYKEDVSKSKKDEFVASYKTCAVLEKKYTGYILDGKEKKYDLDNLKNRLSDEKSKIYGKELQINKKRTSGNKNIEKEID